MDTAVGRVYQIVDRVRDPSGEGDVPETSEMIEAISGAIVDPIKESTNRPETIRAILQVKMPEEEDEEAGSGPYRRWRRLGLAVAMLKCRLMADNAMDYFGVVANGDTARSWKQITGTMQHMFGMLHADTAIAALLGDDAVAQDHTSEFAWMRTDLLVDPAGLNHRQRLILYLLHRAAATEGGLRRDGETLYKQRWTQRVRCLDRCTVCGECMADHPTDILSRRSHVFRPTFEVVEGSQWTRTYAWVPLAAETRTEDSSGVPRVQHGDSTIRTFIKTECSKDRCFDAWSDLTKSGGDEESAVRYLSGALDNELPLLERSEGLFAFVNGIYDADTDKFHPFYDAAGNPAPVPIGDRCVYQYYHHWMPWDEIEAETDGPKKRNRQPMQTCRHCQQPLHRHRTARCTTPDPEPCSSTTETRRCDEAWRSIKTPIIDAIFEYQRFVSDKTASAMDQLSEFTHVCTWVFAFLGRLLFKLNSRDRWQVVLWIIGHAGTGKSTLIDVMKMFFRNEDVGIVQNNMDPKFGMESYINMTGPDTGRFKRLLVCPEVKNGFGMPQSIFQQLASGDAVSVQRKGLRNVIIENPECNMFNVGNEGPGYDETSGAFGRRSIEVQFLEEVADQHKDGLLIQRFASRELGRFLVKACRAYREMSEKYGSYSVWGSDPFRDGPILPNYFHLSRKRIERQANSVRGLVEDSDLVRIDKHGYMPLAVLCEKWRTHCRNCNIDLKGVVWNANLYGAAFRKLGLEVINDKRRWPIADGRVKRSDYVVGISVVDPDADDDDEEEQQDVADAAAGGQKRIKNDWTHYINELCNNTSTALELPVVGLLIKRLMVDRGAGFDRDQADALLMMVHPDR